MSKILDEKAIISRICLLREKYAGKRGKALFANALGISPSTYNYYEQNRLPPIGVLWSICRLTGADIQWLLTGQSGKTAELQPNTIPVNLHEKIITLLQKNPQPSPVYPPPDKNGDGWEPAPLRDFLLLSCVFTNFFQTFSNY